MRFVRIFPDMVEKQMQPVLICSRLLFPLPSLNVFK